MATIKLTNNVKISEDSLETPKVYTVTKTNVTVGGRSDGSCTWYKHGNWVTMESRLIGSGAKTYTLTNFIPEGYRPAYEVRTGINGVASGAVNMYGHVQLSTDGTVIIFSSGTGSTEPIFSITYWTSQSESGGSGGGGSGGGSGDSGGSGSVIGVGGFESVLLWTNSSPNAAFAAQTIPLDLSDYDLVLIEGKYALETDGSIFSVIGRIGPEKISIACPHKSGSGGNYIRQFTATTTGVQFYDGFLGGTGTSNSANVPWRIYGMKSNSILPLVDWSNLITSEVGSSGTWTYTATQDCYVYFAVSNNGSTTYKMTVNGHDISSATIYAKSGLLPLASGDILACSGDNNGYSYYVFGIKVKSNSSALPENYSTTEQRIGTWTDGRPLYRKVILDTYTQNTGNARNLNISGVYQYIKVEVNFIPLATSATNSVSTTPYYYGSSDYLYYYLSTPATGQLTIKGGSDWPKTSPIAIIVTYTKQS